MIFSPRRYLPRREDGKEGKKLKTNSGNIAKHLQVKTLFFILLASTRCNNIKERMEIYDDSLRRPLRLSPLARKCDGCDASDGGGMN